MGQRQYPSNPTIQFGGALPPGDYVARLSVPGEPARERRFEVVADLPRTATGKIQRHKLRELLRRDRH